MLEADEAPIRIDTCSARLVQDSVVINPIEGELLGWLVLGAVEGGEGGARVAGTRTYASPRDGASGGSVIHFAWYEYCRW